MQLWNDIALGIMVGSNYYLCLKVRSSEFLGESVHDLRVWVSWFLRMLVCGLVLDEKIGFRND